MDQTQEVGRLRGDLEKKTLLYEEELARREAQHSAELKALRKELRDAESQHLALQKEVLVLKDKLEKTRRERYLSPFLHHVLIRTNESCFMVSTLLRPQYLCPSLFFSVIIASGNFSLIEAHISLFSSLVSTHPRVLVSLVFVIPLKILNTRT